MTTLITIGLNYQGQLHGCIRDSLNVKDFFTSRQPLLSCTQMLDSFATTNPLYPSRSNIEAVLKTIPSASQRVVVHYSGHGSQTRDRNNDERDRKDEMLVPADYMINGFITDDWLYRNVVLRSKVPMLFVIDACHSGTMLDLKYVWQSMRRGGFARTIDSRFSSEKPNVTLLSGCLDSQYSYETNDVIYGTSGMLTSAWLNALVTRSSRNPAVLIPIMQKNTTNQTFQISCSRKIVPLWSYI